MTVATLMKRLSEFVGTEPGSSDAVVYNKSNDRLCEIVSTEKTNDQGQVYFEIRIEEMSGK